MQTGPERSTKLLICGSLIRQNLTRSIRRRAGLKTSPVGEQGDEDSRRFPVLASIDFSSVSRERAEISILVMRFATSSGVRFVAMI